jgi:uncharacterized protein (UPF0128 family)
MQAERLLIYVDQQHRNDVWAVCLSNTGSKQLHLFDSKTLEVGDMFVHGAKVYKVVKTDKEVSENQHENGPTVKVHARDCC